MPHVVVCYDVVDDRKRGRLCRFLRTELDHVQRSVFEGRLDDLRLIRVRARIPTLIDPNVDTVRIYSICRRDVEAIEIIGTGIPVEERHAIIR